MKVMHLLQSHHFSGAENVVCQICSMFRDYDEYSMVYVSSKGPIEDALLERNIEYYGLDKFDLNHVRKAIKEIKPDIIHAHDMRASFVASLVCGKIPIVSHIHNNSFDSRGLSVKSIAYVLAAIKAKRIIWVSDSSLKGYFFHRLFMHKSEVLYNIIDIDALYSKMKLDDRKYDYDIVYLGRLSEPKNPLRLVEVIRKIVDLKPDVKVAIIGTGELESSVKARANELKLNSNVEFLGFVSNPYKILYDSKVMIMTSLWEGTPMCVLEALSLGVPVVSTPTDGIVRIIENNKNGYLCDKNEQLVRLCLDIISDEQLHKELSFNSLKTAKRIMDADKYRNCIIDSYSVYKENI